MLEIFRLQIRHIIDGKRKWLVVLLLALPIAITWLNVGVGGITELRDGPQPRHRASAKPISDRELAKLFPDAFRVDHGRLLCNDRRVRPNDVIVVNDGYVVVEKGQAWLDESAGTGEPPELQKLHRRRVNSIEGLGWSLFCAIYLFMLYPQSICLLLALFYGSSLLGTELDNKTITYLFTRPIARWRVVVGKYLAIAAALIPPTAASVAASWLLLERPGGVRLLAGMEAGACGAVLGYTAVFVLIGFLVPRRAMVVGLLWGLVFEFALSLFPALVNGFTVTYQLRSLVVAIVGIELPPDLLRIIGDASVASALLALFSMIAIGLIVSARLAARREYVVTEQP
jgi:ABC-type transport system involved in multi-copper enzyme maturation permease subunit